MSSDLSILWESQVRPEHIDGLGHMNTKFYAVNARAAADRMLRALGLTTQVFDGDRLFAAFPDLYTRFRKEQLEGALLAVRGGVLAVEEGGLRLYLELINRGSDEVAATFVQTAVLQETGSHAQLPLPALVTERALERRVALPDYAQPRTLSLEPPRIQLTLPEALRRGLRTSTEPVLIDDQWCDADGFLRMEDSHILFMIAHGRQPGQKAMTIKDNNFRDAGGQLLGWAMMESRQNLMRLPRAGEAIESFQATTQLLDKVHSTTRWIFTATGELCAVLQTVALAFDIAARRPVSIPAADRGEMLASYHPDLD